LVLLGALTGWTANDGQVGDLNRVSSAPIAVWPVHNLSAGPAPLAAIRQSIISELKNRGVVLVPEERLQRFIDSQRLRYAGGLDPVTAQGLNTETGAKAVLITTLEHYNITAPPKIALSARLVAADAVMPRILWMTGVGLAGDESPGLLELHLIEDPDVLTNQALARLTGELMAYLAGGSEPTEVAGDGKFSPEVLFVPPALSPVRSYTVAVLPFFNNSYRKHAGEIMGLHFVHYLRGIANFTVVEPGSVRQALLRSRVVMDDGISLSDAAAVFNRLNVDLIATGQVLDYQDYLGRGGAPRVGFSAEIIARGTRQVVWLTRSHHTGDEGVYFFDLGKTYTAHTLAAKMVDRAVGSLQQEGATISK
jgi:hypothetical protein